MRKNRITAVGNDLYSVDSRSFLNPFLRILRRVLFPLWTGTLPSRWHLCLGFLLGRTSRTRFAPGFLSFAPPRSLSSIFSRPPISPSLVKLSRSSPCVTRFRERKLSCLANHALVLVPLSLCSLSFPSHSPVRFAPRFFIPVRESRLCVTNTREQRAPRELCARVTRVRMRTPLVSYHFGKLFFLSFPVARLFYGFLDSTRPCPTRLDST